MFEPLTGKRIVLSKIAENDSQMIYRAIKGSMAEISLWATWLHPNYKRNDAEAFVKLQIKNWNENNEFSFTIKNHSGDLLGVISLHVFDQQNDVANIGYWMNSKHTCHGYCTEAVKLLVSEAFKQLNLIRVELIAGVENIASQKVAKKSGAQFEVILKNRIKPNGITSNAHLYAFTTD